jgi:glycosyltransferase involved in cell wall biosynthesis
VSNKKLHLKRAIALLPAALRRGGGLRGTMAKAIRLYQREGFVGIQRGLRIVQTALDSDGFDRNDYAEWVRRYDTLTDEKRVELRAYIETLPVKPLISVVMPVYNTKSEWLREAIESVRTQIYPHWELCMADDASTDKAIRPILERYAKEDPRIKIVFRQENGHISAASNSALELVASEWVALLDSDDLLAEHALLWVADAINRHPQARLIYSDEDKVNKSGTRFSPYFKCDWNVDLFYSHNMYNHLGVYHAALLRDLSGFRLGFEGSQDYDIVLRCSEHIKPSQIHHIPRILYHWRAHAQSTSQAVNAKPYAFSAGKRALDEHLKRQGVNATAELLDIGMYRIRYALPDVLPLVSLIIPTRNRLQLLRKCIESILKKTTYPNYEILIIDNGSDELATLRGLEQLQSDPRIRVVRDDRPFNFSELNNAAVKLARGQIVGLLNNDLEVISPEWLSEMASHALRPEVGVVGARLWYFDKTLQHAGVVLGVGDVAGHAHKHLPRYRYGYFGRASLIQSFSAVTAACLVIRKSVYEEVGGFNEADLQVAFNDIDFCLRVREAGYRNIWTPYAELYHYESTTRGFEDRPEKQARFAREIHYMKQRWGDQLLSDPAYSPNLTLDREDFSLAWPPRIALFPPAGSIS